MVQTKSKLPPSGLFHSNFHLFFFSSKKHIWYIFLIQDHHYGISPDSSIVQRGYIGGPGMLKGKQKWNVWVIFNETLVSFS